MVGNIQLEDFSPCKLPQRAASAWSAVTSGLTGAHYDPLLFLGEQVTKGNVFWFIAERTLITAEPKRNIVKLGINEFQGEYKIVKPVEVLA